MLAFSVAVRDRDPVAIARFVADEIRSAPWPKELPVTERLDGWIERRNWPVADAGAPIAGAEWTASLARFLARLSEVEDARFKVKSADFDSTDGGRGSAHLKFFVVARDEQGRREWLKGLAEIEIRREAEQPWRITAFQLESMESKLSEVDLFSEVAQRAGVSATFLPFGVGRNQGFISHGAAAADVDGDGRIDLAATGVDENYLYLNAGDGRFRDASAESLVKFAPRGSGLVFLDFDNDGDPDIFLTTVQREAHFLFRNNVGQNNNFIRVELVGNTRGRDAYGAVVRVKSSTGVQTKVKAGGSGFLSQHDPRLSFGLGQDPAAEWIEVTWPDGTKERFPSVHAGSTLRLIEGRPAPEQVSERRFRLIDPPTADERAIADLGLKLGERFPAIALRSSSGEPTQLESSARPGRRRLVNIWATWCAACVLEVPELARLQQPLARAGVDLIGISVDLDTKAAVPGYLESHGARYPSFTTDEAGLETLYPRGEARVPLSVLIDDRGRVLEIYPGRSERSRTALERLVQPGPGYASQRSPMIATSKRAAWRSASSGVFSVRGPRSAICSSHVRR